MLGDELLDIVLGGQRRVLQLLGRNGLAGDELDRRSRRPAGPCLCVCCVAVTSKTPSFSAFERRDVAVEAGDPDLVAEIGDLDRLRRAERQRVGLAEDDRDVRDAPAAGSASA